MRQQGIGEPPAAVHLADQIVGRNPYVVEEELADLVLAGQIQNRTHRDARRVEIDDQTAQPAMFRRAGIGAHQGKHPLRVMSPGLPDLVAVDDEVIAVETRGCFHRREVGSRIGFGIALRPFHLGAQNSGQMVRLLRFGPEIGDDRPDEIEPHGNQHRHPDPDHLLGQDELLVERCPHSADLSRPVRRDPAAPVEFTLPTMQRVGRRPGNSVLEFVGGVRLQPVADLEAKRTLVLAVDTEFQSRSSSQSSM